MARATKILMTMRCTAIGLLAAVLVTGVWLSTAIAQSNGPTKATMPIYAQIMRFFVPAGYAPVFSKDNEGRFFIFEMVPKGETIQKWSGMVTLTGTRHGVSASPKAMSAYIQQFTSGFEKACPRTFAAKPIDGFRLGNHPAVTIYLSCGKLVVPATAPAGHSESAVIAFIEGAQDLYTVQWAERGKPQDTPIPFDAANWQAKLSMFKAIRLCPRVQGEAAPYPSCLAVP